jgi:hypothetical protein
MNKNVIVSFSTFQRHDCNFQAYYKFEGHALAKLIEATSLKVTDSNPDVIGIFN